MFKLTSLAIAATVSVLMSSTSMTAQTIEIPSIPSDGVISRFDKGVIPPALQYLIENGVKLTYLGDSGGLEGFLGESSTGSIQTFYLTPDSNHVIAGVLFKKGGVNVTGIQINDMKNRYEEAKKRMDVVSEDLNNTTIETPIEPQITAEMREITPEEIQAGEAAVVTVDKFLSPRDLDKFNSDVDRLAWFSVGASDAPVVYFIADPQCPFCHRAWSQIRPMVMAREISVRVILIAGLEGSKEKAISILSRDEPGRAWFAGEGSTKGMPIAPAPASGTSKYNKASKFLDTNQSFSDVYGLDATPWLFAVKGDQLYEMRGWGEDTDLFMSLVRE